MAKFARATPTGWVQGDDASRFAHVTPTGWIQGGDPADGISGPIGRADEAGQAVALAGALRGAPPRSDEACVAFGLAGAQRGALGLSVDAAIALPFHGRHQGAIAAAAEADEALGLAAAGIPGLVGLAVDPAEGLGLSGSQRGLLGIALQAEQAIGRPGRVVGTVAPALDVQAALSRPGVVRGSVGLATEADQALQLEPAAVGGEIGLAVDAASAFGLAGQLRGAVGLAIEADVALLPIVEIPPALQPPREYLRIVIAEPVRRHVIEAVQRTTVLPTPARRSIVPAGLARNPIMAVKGMNAGARLFHEFDARGESPGPWLRPGDRLVAGTAWSVPGGSKLTIVNQDFDEGRSWLLLDLASDAAFESTHTAILQMVTEQGERDTRTLEVRVTKT